MKGGGGSCENSPVACSLGHPRGGGAHRNLNIGGKFESKGGALALV